VRQIQRVCRRPCPSSALEIGKISIRQDFLQRFMARVVCEAVDLHREIPESRTRLFLLGAPTAVATQSGRQPYPRSDSYVSISRRKDVLKRRAVAQEISLPWEPLQMGSSEMKKIALSWRLLVHLRIHMRDSVDMAVWMQEWMVLLGSNLAYHSITPLGCSGISSLLVKIATIHMRITWS
jgi:hypothetical protein